MPSREQEVRGEAKGPHGPGASPLLVVGGELREPANKCGVCGSSFLTPKLLIKHQKDDHGAKIPRQRRKPKETTK
jgi:hypothetical protein